MRQCFLFLLLTACSFGYQERFYITRADMLSARVWRTYQEKNQLIQESSGGGMFDDVDLICGGFVGYRKVDIDEGRRLFVEGIETLCAAFNNDPVIRPYLHNYPFVQKNIELMLSFEDPNDFRSFPAPDLSLIYCVHNIVFYDSYNRETRQYSTFYSEPYEEAVRIVHEQREAANRSCEEVGAASGKRA